MNWTVRSDHILVGILNGLSSSTNEPSSNYRIARDVALTYTSPRGIVSPVNYGKVQFKSNFYGHECQEILIEHLSMVLSNKSLLNTIVNGTQ